MARKQKQESEGMNIKTRNNRQIKERQYKNDKKERTRKQRQ